MMKKIALTLAASLAIIGATAAPRAIYVKDATGVHRYSFGVAGDLKFSQDGKTLYVSGYEQGIDLGNIDYISFEAPFDETGLTPDAQKDKILNTGKEFVNLVKPYENEALIQTLADWEEYVIDWDLDWYALQEKFERKHPDFYEDDDDAYYKKFAGNVLNGFAKIMRGDAAGANVLRKEFTELFTVQDLTGVFRVDEEEEAWVMVNDADYFELQFSSMEPGVTNYIRITPSKDYTTWVDKIEIPDDYRDPEEINVVNGTVQVPRSVVVSVKRGNNEIAAATLDIVMNQAAKTIVIDMKGNVGTLAAHSVLNVATDNCVQTTTYTIGGREAMTSTTTVKGQDIVNVQDWIDGVNQSNEYWDDDLNEYVEGDRTIFNRMFRTAVADVDVLGKVQVKSHVADIEKIVNALDDYNDKYLDSSSAEIDYGKGTAVVMDGNLAEITNVANLINDYADATVYLDGTSAVQAFATLMPYVEEDDDPYMSSGYHNGNQWIEFDKELLTYYNYVTLGGLFTFADGTSYSHDNGWFEGIKYQVVTDDIESIVDTIENILDSYYEEYDEDDYYDDEDW